MISPSALHRQETIPQQTSKGGSSQGSRTPPTNYKNMQASIIPAPFRKQLLRVNNMCYCAWITSLAMPTSSYCTPSRHTKRSRSSKTTRAMRSYCASLELTTPGSSTRRRLMNSSWTMTLFVNSPLHTLLNRTRLLRVASDDYTKLQDN